MLWIQNKACDDCTNFKFSECTVQLLTPRQRWPWWPKSKKWHTSGAVRMQHPTAILRTTSHV